MTTATGTANWFPSREWLSAYREALNDNETYREANEGWGVEFEGDFVFEVTDVPVAERTIGELHDDLSAELRDDLESLSDERVGELVTDAPPALEARMADRGESYREESGRERLVGALLSTSVEDAPDVTWPALLDEVSDELENLLDQLERYVEDDTVYAYLDLYDGECREADVLEDPASREVGFVLTGPYSKWTELIEGADVLEAVMSQDMDLDGSITTIIGYGKAAQEMGDTAGRVDARFLF